jgi:hypothetical protein
MTLKLLQETIRVRLLSAGAAPDTVEGYFSQWDLGLHQDSAAPLRCPNCYVREGVSFLRRLPSPAGIGIVECPACSASFEFPDFQRVASAQGIWPTSESIPLATLSPSAEREATGVPASSPSVPD